MKKFNSVWTALMAVLLAALLTACGGGGGGADPATPAASDGSTSSAQEVPKDILAISVNADGTVMVASVAPIVGGTASWMLAGAKQSFALTPTAAGAKTALITLGGAPAKLPEGVTSVTASATHLDGIPQPNPTTVDLTWCPNGTSISGVSCKVPAWHAIVDVDTDGKANPAIRFIDKDTGGSSLFKMDGQSGRPSPNECVNADKLGSHGGVLVACSGSTAHPEQAGVYEVGPPATDGTFTFWVKISAADKAWLQPEYSASTMSAAWGTCPSSSLFKFANSGLCTDGNTVVVAGKTINFGGALRSAWEF